MTVKNFVYLIIIGIGISGCDNISDVSSDVNVSNETGISVENNATTELSVVLDDNVSIDTEVVIIPDKEDSGSNSETVTTDENDQDPAEDIQPGDEETDGDTNIAIVTENNDTDSDINIVVIDENSNTEETIVSDEADAELSVQKETLAVEEKATNWYIRLVAESITNKIQSSDAQFGVLDEVNATQKHTLSAFSPMGSDYLDIVFENPVGMESGNYKTNFQEYADNSEYRWRFTVKTDNVNDQIALTWRGVYVLTPYTDNMGRLRYKEIKSMHNPIIKNMKLIDLTTGNTMVVLSGDRPKVYYFKMNGQTEHTFEWIVLPDSTGSSEESK